MEPIFWEWFGDFENPDGEAVGPNGPPILRADGTPEYVVDAEVEAGKVEVAQINALQVEPKVEPNLTKKSPAATPATRQQKNAHRKFKNEKWFMAALAQAKKECVCKAPL